LTNAGDVYGTVSGGAGGKVRTVSLSSDSAGFSGSYNPPAVLLKAENDTAAQIEEEKKAEALAEN